MYIIFVSNSRAEIFSYRSVDAAVRKLYEDATGIECMHRLGNEGDLQDYIEMYSGNGHEIIDHRELVPA
jgi:hypothetical protein